MAKTDTTDAVWHEIDVDSLSEQCRMAYDAYKAKQREAAALKAEFETVMNATAGMPKGKRLVFGYRFGKLSAAIVEAEAPKAKPKGTSTLGDFLKMQAASGARV